MQQEAPDEVEALGQLLSIDEENLPQEWHEQPKQYTRIARYAARCHALEADAELEIKLLEADLDESIRSRPSEKRLTDRAVEQEIRRDPKWRNAQRHRIKKAEISEIADALQKASEMRERSLIRLSQRHLGGNLEDDERLLAIVKKLVREQFLRGQRNG